MKLSEIIERVIKPSLRILIATSIVGFFLTISLWYEVIYSRHNNEAKIYFLSVGQGDSELVIFPGGAKMLIDGGPPNGMLVKELEKVLPVRDRTIDIVMMSHAQLDHYGGFLDLFRRYQVSSFVWNGRSQGATKAFFGLEKEIKDAHVPMVVLIEGDRIRYGKSIGEILSPSKRSILAKDLNDTALVMRLFMASSTTLFTGDAGPDIEQHLIKRYSEPIDILKIAHHGSRFSSTAQFLNVFKPLVAGIEVGKNSYGHPTPQVLERLADISSRIFRTDKDGTIELRIKDGKITVEKSVLRF